MHEPAAAPNRTPRQANSDTRTSWSSSVFFWAQTFAILSLITRPIRFARESALMFFDASLVEWDLDLSNMFMGASLMLFAASVLIRPRMKSIAVHRSAITFWLFLIVWAFMSLLWAYSPNLSFHANLQLTMYFVLFLLIGALAPRYADLDRWGRAFLWLAILNLVGSVLEIYAYDYVGAIGVAGEGPRRSFLASFPQRALPALAFGLHYSMFSPKKPQKTFGFLAIVASLGSIYLTARRAGMLGVAFVFILYGFMIGWRNRHFKIMSVITGFAVALMIILNPNFGERMASIPLVGQVTFEEWQADDAIRVAQYTAGFVITAEHPWTGIGLHGPRLWIREVMGFSRYIGQHSMFLALSAGLGITGLLMYLLFLGAVLSNGRRAFRAHKKAGNMERASLVAAVICAFAVLIFYGQFQSLLLQPPVYIAAGLCAATLRRRHFEDNAGA